MNMKRTVVTERFDGNKWTLPDGAMIIEAKKTNYVNYDTGTSIEYKDCYFPQPGNIISSGTYWDVTYIIPEEK